jgi:hypothetical protein
MNNVTFSIITKKQVLQMPNLQFLQITPFKKAFSLKIIPKILQYS